MKRKLISIALVLALAMALLAGCGGSAGTSSGSSAPAQSSGSSAAAPADNSGSAASSSEGGKKIAFTVPSLANDFMVALTGALQGALEEAGCTVQIDSADGDVTKQTNQVENYAQMGFDAVIVWPVNAPGISSIVKRVGEQGIQTLAFANPIDGATASLVSADDYGMGQAEAEMCSDWLNATFPDAGDKEIKVLFVASSSAPEAVSRSEGIQTLKDINSKVNPIIEEIDWNDPNSARSTIENALLVNSDVKAICAVNGTSAVAANSYVMSANSPIDDKATFAVFGVDETSEIDDAIRASVNNESVYRGTVSMGSIGDTVHDFMKCLTPFLEGGSIETVNGEAFKITPDALG